MVPNIHQVQKQYLHVELIGTEADGLSLQHGFPRLCQNTLMPALDRMLERIVPAHEYWFIDRLEIDAGVLSLEKLESELVEAVVREAEKQLRTHVVSATLAGASASKQSTTDSAEANAAVPHREDASAGPSGGEAQTAGRHLHGQQLPVDPTDVTGSIRRRTEAQSIHDAFLHFLKTGSLPWWFHLPAGKSLEQAVQASWQIPQTPAAAPAYFKRSLVELMRFASVQERLVQQFSADFLQTLLAILAPENAQAVREVLAKLEGASFASAPHIRRFCAVLWQTALAAAGAGRRQTADNLIVESWNRIQDRPYPADSIETLLEHFAPKSAQALSGILVKLGKAELGVESLDHFSRLLKESAIADAFAGKRHTAVSLVAECWNSLPDMEKERHAALREWITQHWPAALQPKPQGIPEAAIRLHRDSSKALSDVLTGAMAKQSKEDSKPAGSLEVKEGIYISCAGLVLLHPFLPRLFKVLGIADEDTLLQPERALCLLHYLATGHSIAPEYELQLPKLLCNLPLEHPVESDVNLTAAELEEAAGLLDAAVRHWDALGNTSGDGLRGAFLVRRGKLSARSNGDWLLQVETNSFDILLDQLPWGFGMIKLPWMEKILWVEWR